MLSIRSDIGDDIFAFSTYDIGIRFTLACWRVAFTRVTDLAFVTQLFCVLNTSEKKIFFVKAEPFVAQIKIFRGLLSEKEQRTIVHERSTVLASQCQDSNVLIVLVLS